MDNCGQACPHNTLYGCKVKEHNAICPLTNMATPITEYRMTNADRIRAMTDEELAELLANEVPHDCAYCNLLCATFDGDKFVGSCQNAFYRWLQQPAEEGEEDGN